MMEQFSVRTAEGCGVTDITEQVASRLAGLNGKPASACLIYVKVATEEEQGYCAKFPLQNCAKNFASIFTIINYLIDI